MVKKNSDKKECYSGADDGPPRKLRAYGHAPHVPWRLAFSLLLGAVNEDIDHTVRRIMGSRRSAAAKHSGAL